MMAKDQAGDAPVVVSKRAAEKPWKQKRRPPHSSQDVEIFEAKTVLPHPSLVEVTSVHDGYIRITCMDDCSFLVPRKVVDSFKCIDVILHSEVSFKERLENVICFPDMSAQVLETVLRFVFTEHLNKLKAERYYGSLIPNIVFQFEVTPTQAMDIIHAAHFLGVSNLLSIASTMVAHHLQDVPDLSSLPPDLAWCIAEQLSVKDLFLAEERSDFLALNLETEILWEKHCKNLSQEEIVPIPNSSAFPPYNAWHTHLGPPPTSWKSLCLAYYLQQLADRQNGGEKEEFMVEVSEKGKHAYCHTVHPIFWEWVIQEDTKFFVSYISFFKNILKLSLSGLPLGKLFKDDVLSSPFSSFFQSLPLLQYLNISEAGLGPEAAVLLSTGLKEHKCIQVLNISYNSIETQGFSALTQVLPSVRTLKVLDLCENGIGASVDVKVVEALKEAALEEFILEGNFRSIKNVSDSSAAHMPTRIMNRFHDHDNNIEVMVYEPLLKQLVMNGLPKYLRVLNYARCELDDARAKVLVRSLSSLPCIQKLNLAGNKLTSEGATSVLLWLQENTTLQELNLSDNYITESCSPILCSTISSHPCLEKLSLMGNFTYGEENLHEVLRAASDRGMKLQPKNFTLNLRLTGIAHLAEVRIQRQRNVYTGVELLI